MTVKVKVYAPGFIDHTLFDQNGYVEVAENESLNTLFKRLRIPFVARRVLASYVNYEPAKLNTKLQDGDVISFLFPISGG